MSIDEVTKSGDTDKKDEMENKQAPENVPPKADESKEAGLPAPFIGFDGEGFFVFRINPAFGYHAIQGYLAEASQWLRQIMVQAQRKEAMEKEAKKLTKPGNKFGLKLFS